MKQKKMIPDLAKEILFQSVGIIWPWLRRKIYPQNYFENDVIIKPRSDNPVIFSLNSEIPYGVIYFEIDSKSQYLDFWFDRALMTISVYNPYHEILNDHIVISKKKILKKGRAHIFTKFLLNERQIKVLSAVAVSRNLKCDLRIESWITSELYDFSKNYAFSDIFCNADTPNTHNETKIKDPQRE